MVPKQFTLDGEPVDINEFIKANAITDQELDAINALPVGGRIDFGDPAVAEFVLERVF